MKLAHLLFTQGFGSRRECESLVVNGHVAVDGTVCDDPSTDVEAESLSYSVHGEPWVYQARALLLMNKPAGYECSQQPGHHPSVYSLLPAPLRRRGVQSIGRLDQDTTGLLLFTDDGQLNHRLISPKRHVPKMYEVGCKHAVTETQVAQLLAGVTLHDDPAPVRAADAQLTGPRPDGLHGLRLVLTAGKYHQVKRMVAAVGNRVEALHRSGFGGLRLPEDLPAGEWRWLSEAEAGLLTENPQST